jgi:hypothetical protein
LKHDSTSKNNTHPTLFNFKGYYELRKQINGSALPSARLINDKIFMGRELYHVDENNILLLPFAQLLAHDITGLPDDTLFDEQGTETYIITRDERIFCGFINRLLFKCFQ